MDSCRGIKLTKLSFPGILSSLPKVSSLWLVSAPCRLWTSMPVLNCSQNTMLLDLALSCSFPVNCPAFLNILSPYTFLAQLPSSPTVLMLLLFFHKNKPGLAAPWRKGAISLLGLAKRSQLLYHLHPIPKHFVTVQQGIIKHYYLTTIMFMYDFLLTA